MFQPSQIGKPTVAVASRLPREDAKRLQTALSIVKTLPADQQDAGYLNPDPNERLADLGPREIAALIPRA